MALALDKSNYKYHYEIYKSGVLYDCVQDSFMLCCAKQQIIKMWGITHYKNFTFKKVRISKEEWKKRYC